VCSSDLSGLGLRLMLAEFSPLPGTPDGELCRQWVDLDEPLCHNKTAFATGILGEAEVNRLKNLCRGLNAGRALLAGSIGSPGEGSQSQFARAGLAGLDR
jgi:hypothetical protein